MKTAFIVLMAELPAITAVVGAVLMALNDKQGWGWLLFIAVLLGSSSIKVK